jgi:hypothetical protein
MADVVDLAVVRRTRRAASVPSLPNLIETATALALLAGASWLLAIAVFGAAGMTAMAASLAQD